MCHLALLSGVEWLNLYGERIKVINILYVELVLRAGVELIEIFRIAISAIYSLVSMQLA